AIGSVGSIRFVRFVEVEKGLDVRAILKASLAFHLLERFSETVAPTAFRQKRIEHEDVFLIRPAAMFKAPFENFLIRATIERSFDDGRIVELKKSADARVRASAVLVIGRQLALPMQANFVEHASEKDDAADLFRRVSKVWNFHMRLRRA